MERLELNLFAIIKVEVFLKKKNTFLIMHIMIGVTQNKRNTFSHVVIHNELEVFTAA